MSPAGDRPRSIRAVRTQTPTPVVERLLTSRVNEGSSFRLHPMTLRLPRSLGDSVKQGALMFGLIKSHFMSLLRDPSRILRIPRDWYFRQATPSVEEAPGA